MVCCSSVSCAYVAYACRADAIRCEIDGWIRILYYNMHLDCIVFLAIYLDCSASTLILFPAFCNIDDILATRAISSIF